jgi:hypothetical protein
VLSIDDLIDAFFTERVTALSEVWITQKFTADSALAFVLEDIVDGYLHGYTLLNH